MSFKSFVTSDINMVSTTHTTTQIVVVCMALSLSSAEFIFKNHHRRPQNDFEDFPKLLTEMFHPRNPMQGLLQINPINHPGILGFHSFGGDLSGGMFVQGQGGYGTEDSMPPSSPLFQREDGNSEGPVYDFSEQGKDSNVGTEPPQNEFGDQIINENDQNKPDDSDISNNDRERGKSDSAEKEKDDKKPAIPSETDSASDSNKNQPEENSVSKHRESSAIVFPDSVDQAKDKISKESSYYVSPQPSNGYVSSPGPQIVYAVSIPPSGSSSNPVSYVPTTVQSNSPSPTTINTVQSYPPTNNINIQNPQPQYQTNGNSPTSNVVTNNPTTNPGYTLVTLPNNGVNSNSPVYYTNNAPVSNPPQNTNYQPLTTGQQYYLVSMNGQNVLVPVSNVQNAPNQPNGNSQINLIPINAPSSSQVNYVPVSNQNVSPSTPQNNGQVHYIAVQLAPQNNNQVSYMPANQGIVQTPAQSTAQGSANYVPVNSQPTVQNPPQYNNQVTYVPATQGNVQAPAQNAAQGSVTYVPVNTQPTIQNSPQTNNQVTYVPANQGIFQTPAQNTAQGSVTYVPVNSQPTFQNPPKNQVTYVSGSPTQVVQMAPNQPQGSNQVNYVSANPQAVGQVGSNSPTNSGQITYVPLNTQNPQSTTQYQLVPMSPQNTGQSNLVKLVPATLTSNGNVPLLVFKEKAKLSPKDKKKHNETN